MVEQGRGVEARAGGELGDRSRRGGPRQAAGAAAVDELELGAASRTASTIRGRRRADVALGGGLHAADRGAAQRAAGNPVADAGDVALVGHHPGQPGAGPLGDLGRDPARRLGRPDRRALRADPSQLAADGPPAEVEVQADAHLGRAAADRRLDQVEVGRRVDHRHRCPRGVLGRQARPAPRAPRGRRWGRRRRRRRSPGAASHSASGSVKARMPRNPGSRSRMRRSTATERTDLEAIRIGLPAAWASMKRAFAAGRRGRRTRTAA